MAVSNKRKQQADEPEIAQNNFRLRDSGASMFIDGKEFSGNVQHELDPEKPEVQKALRNRYIVRVTE